MIIVIVWIIFCLLVGILGESRNVGFWGAVLWSFFLSPLVGLIIVLLSDKKGIQQNPAMLTLIKQGDSLFTKSNYDGAIEKYSSALKYSDNAPYTNFKLAELYSIKKDGQNSFKHLVLAIQTGFKDFAKIHNNNNLTYLRSLQEFQTFVSNNYKNPTVQPDINRPMSKVEELEKLNGFFEKGVLTKEEFENEKRKLLSRD